MWFGGRYQGRNPLLGQIHVTAMLFILFDIDVVFLIPWVLTHRELMACGIPVLWPMLFFTFVLAVGLIYELKSGYWSGKSNRPDSTFRAENFR